MPRAVKDEDDARTRARVTIDVERNDVVRRALARAVNEARDERVRERCADALRAGAERGRWRVDYDVVFDAFEALRENGDDDALAVDAVKFSTELHFEIERVERALTREEELERDAHRARMAALREEVEERKYREMTRDVDFSRERAMGNASTSFGRDARAYGVAAHVVTIMFAFACVGFVGGAALERGDGGAAWARGLGAALGAALGLMTEVALLILRETRAEDAKKRL